MALEWAPYFAAEAAGVFGQVSAALAVTKGDIRILDAAARRIIDPPLNRLGRLIAGLGVSANAVTSLGFGLGLGAALSIALGFFWLGLVLIVVSRLADGLDGAVARATKPTDIGGFFDIVADFVFYGSIPFAFAVANPDANALAATFLIFSFYANGSAFLAYSTLAERRGMKSTAQGQKTLYYVGGLLEGTETIGLFLLLCLFPDWFAMAAWIFGAICFVSAAARAVLAWRAFAAS